MKYKITKKHIMAAAAIVCMLLFFFASESRAVEPESGEVVILIDSSGSVRGYENEIQEWAEALGAYVQGMGVCVDLRSFGNPKNVQSLYRGTIENSAESEKKSDLEIYMDALSVIGSGDQWTDQRGAMKDAIPTLNSSDAQKKCIIMLSDGWLDYEIDEEEEDARCEFVHMVDEFAREKDHEIILVKFGAKDEIFKWCREATVLEGKEFSEPALEEISKALRIKREKGEGERQGDNQISFRLEEKDYYRVVLNIRTVSNDREMSREELNEITVFNGENPVEKDAYSLLSQSCYIYLNDPVPGDYTVSLPDGKWEFYYVSQEKIEVREIHLSVLQDEKTVECNGDEYQIVGEKCTLEIEISSDSSEQLQKGNVKYRVFQLDDGEYQGVQGSAIDGIYEQPLILNGDSEVYECQVKVQQGGIEQKSDIIKIKVDDEPSTSPVPSPVEVSKNEMKVGDSISIKTEFNVSDNNKDYFVYINEKRAFHIDVDAAKDENDTWKYENGELTFLENMEYMVEIKGDEVSMGTKIYLVTNDSFFEKVRRWFIELLH